MKNENWPHGTNLGHPNWTLRTPRTHSGGYAPNSETPTWGWLPTIAVGVAVCAALLWLPTLILRWLS